MQTLEDLRSALDADGWDMNEPGTAVAIAALVVGPNVERIATWLGRSREWCREPAARLRANGVWRGGSVIVENNPPDGVEIAMMTAVADGLVEVASR